MHDPRLKAPGASWQTCVDNVPDLFQAWPLYGLSRLERHIEQSASFREFQQWVWQVERELPAGLLIEIISARLRKANGRDHYDLALMLEGYLRESERDREALELLEELIDRYPDDVRAPMTKAVRLLWFSGDSEGALQAVDIALQRAHRTGFYRREALNNKARILLKLGRGEELSRVLEEIMSLKITKGIPDIGRERDFVDRAPPGMIHPDILARYNEFRPKRLTDTDADEPPLWEPPEDAE